MVPIDHQDLVILMEAGYIYLGMGRFNEAREVFEGVSVLAPESEIPQVAIGTAFFAQMRYDQAAKAYKKALHLKPQSPFAHAYLGETLFFKGQEPEALQELQSASQMDPVGSAGDFARSLLEAIKKGYHPPKGREAH